MTVGIAPRWGLLIAYAFLFFVAFLQYLLFYFLYVIYVYKNNQELYLILGIIMDIKKLCLTLSLIALSGVAVADSTTAPAPATVTPPSSTTSESTYDWTGVYVGGFVGGASGANGTTKSSTQTTSTNNEVIPSGSQSNSTNFITSPSFMGGGTVGYNWQIPKTPYLIGLEGEYGSLGLGGSASKGSSGSLGNYSSTTQTGSDYGYGLIGGRLGYALDRTLFYVKSGAVFTQTNTTMATGPEQLSRGTATSSRGTNTGYAIGGGVEFAPTFYNNKNFTVKVEYLYFGINQSSSDSNTQTEQGYTDGSPPFAGPWTAITATDTHVTTGGISTAKIGFNYKF